MPKLANVSEGDRGTVSSLSAFLALSHVSPAIDVVRLKNIRLPGHVLSMLNGLWCENSPKPEEI
jgi:hypothetical protein